MILRVRNERKHFVGLHKMVEVVVSDVAAAENERAKVRDAIRDVLSSVSLLNMLGGHPDR
jgi:hypothetical protein